MRYPNTSAAAVAVMATLSLSMAASAQRSPVPSPGQAVPDVAGYDEQGERFELSRLKGKHTVIVFGCLT